MFIPALVLLASVRLAPADATADKLVADALGNAPEVMAARASVEAAERRVEPARTLPDPMASLVYKREERLGVMLSQAVPFPGKLALSAHAARSAAEEVRLGEAARAERTVEARVRNAWYDLLLARALDALVDERRAAAQQIATSVRERYAAGLAVQQDVLRAEVEAARVEEEAAARRAAITAALAELRRLTGTAGVPPAGRAGSPPSSLPTETSVPPVDDVIASVRERSPELAAAKQGIETSRLGVALAKRNFLPDFVAGVEAARMWEATAGVSIPVWANRRQRNQLAEAQALAARSEADVETIARELEARTRERLAQLDAAQQTAALYRDKILPLDDLALESALASYRSGKVPFVSVLDALNTLYSDRAIYLTRLADSAKWRVAIDEAQL